METERSSFEPNWRDCSDFCLPNRGQWFGDNNPSQQGSQRAAKRQKIINSTATKAVRSFKAGMMSSHTSPAKPWFRLTTPDPGLMEFAPVKQYLFRAERVLQTIFGKSNFYTAQPSVLEEMAVFGQCPMLIQEDLFTVARFYPLTVGSYYLAANARGEIDTLARKFKMTVRNVAAEFGERNMSANLRQKLQNNHIDDWVDIIRFITPNSDRQYGRADARGMAYRSCHFEATASDIEDRFLKESGSRERPFVCPRWDQTSPEDVYGNSLAADMLGDMKQLQHNERSKAAGIQKLADPQWTAPASMRNVPINGLPGGVTYLPDAQAGEMFKPAYMYPYQGIQVIGAENEILVQRIKEGFFETLLLALSTRDGPQMTAEEVVQIQGEKVAAIGPYLTRLNSEELDPLIDRVFEIALRHPDRILPAPPRELQGVDLKVDYTSILAQAQKLVGGGSIERFLTVGTGLGQFDPGVFDKIDFDQTIDQLADVYGVPPDIVRSDDQVAKLRESRQQQNQMAQMAQMAKPASDMANAVSTLSDTAPTADSVLGRAAQGAAAAQGVV